MFYKNKIKHSICNYRYSILTYLLLFIFSLIFRFSIFNEKYLSNIVYASINALLILLVIIIFSPTKLRIPTVIITSLLISVDIALFYIYNGPMNYSVLASIMETNLTEAHGMGQIVLPAGILSFFISLFFVYKSSLEIKREKRGCWVTIQLTTALIIGVFILPVIFSFSTFINNVSQTVRYNQHLSTIAYYSSIMRLKYPFVIGDIFITAAYFDDMHKLRSESKRKKILPQGIMLKPFQPNIDKIILVIGESSNKAHYSLYGYKKRTTPFLDSLLTNSPETFSYFSNVISPASATRDAIRICLSFSTARDFRPFIEEYNLIDMANNAGYQTIWVSNQNNLSWYENFPNMISSCSDSTIFRTDKTNVFPDDLNLPPIVSQILQPNKRQFIVVHLEGSHMPYSKRYDSIDTKHLGNDGLTIEYDKSIHHTDRVLNNIYQRVQDNNENIIIYYFPDHGEIVNKGHAFVNQWKKQYEIPLIIIQNKQFVNINSIVNKYYNKETDHLNTSSSIFILSELMGYQIADSLVKKAQIESKYIYQPDATYCLYNDIEN